MTPKPPAVRRLRLRNYRSVRDETIEFSNPLFLVGRNGSGKSNVVDAFAFLSDCMNMGFHAATANRPNLAHVDTTNDGGTATIEVELDHGSYVLEFGFELGRYRIVREECRTANESFYRGEKDAELRPSGEKLRLDSAKIVLPALGVLDRFAYVNDAISNFRIYNVNHDEIRNSNESERSEILNGDSSNLLGVLSFLKFSKDEKYTEVFRQVNKWLSNVVPSMKSDVSWMPSRTPEYILQFVQGNRRFSPGSVSDGTLDALGVIVALHQEPAPSLVVIEEPEANLHPGAVAVIAELIQEASERMQVVITTHSPELLDQKWIGADNLRIVTWEDGETRVSELGPVPKRAIQEHLMYPGQLLRANALEPERDEILATA